MANQTKAYFLAPNWDIPPSLVKLGNIIADVAAPHQNLMSSVPPIETPIHRNTLAEFSAAFSTSKSKVLGLWAQFLQVSGLGGDVNLIFSKDKGQLYSSERMESQWFVPSAEFVDKCVQDEEVQSFLRMMPRKTPLYVVTGVKIMLNAHIATIDTKRSGVNGKLGFDGTASGIPVTIGPKLERAKTEGNIISWKCTEPLFFAYQLSRIKLKRSRWVAKDFTKGSMFAYSTEDDKTGTGIEEVESGGNYVDELLEYRTLNSWDEAGEGPCTATISAGVQS